MQQLQLNLGTHFLANLADTKGSHQGLHPEALRLRRVWDAIAQKPFHYCAPGSHVKLGIGQAQLASTVYWLVVLKLAQYHHNYVIPTPRGRWLFQEFDPYFEYAETPWLLHYWGLEPPCLMPAWWWLFNRVNQPEFEQDGMRTKLTEFLQTHTERRNPQAKAHKDLSMILSCYQPPKLFDPGRASLFSPLKLIRTTKIEYGKRSGQTGFYTQYSFTFNNRYVPTQWVAFATVQYAQRKRIRQVSLDELAYEPNSPGQIFKLSEDAIANRLEQAEGIELVLNADHRLQANISDRSKHSINEIPTI